MTFQQEFIGKRVKECSEGWDDELPDELSYALKAAHHVESGGRGLIEAYRNGELRLELSFRSIDYKVGGDLSKNSTIAYRFIGLIGAKHTAIYSDEFPDKRAVQCGKGEHVVLVAIRESVEMYQGMPGPSVGFHLIRLEPIDSADGALVNAIEPTFCQGLREGVRVDANWEQILESGRMAIESRKLVNDVIQGRSQIVDNVPCYCREFEGWLSQHIESQNSAPAVVCIHLRNQRHIRSFVKVKLGFSMEPTKVAVGVS